MRTNKLKNMKKVIEAAIKKIHSENRINDNFIIREDFKDEKDGKFELNVKLICNRGTIFRRDVQWNEAEQKKKTMTKAKASKRCYEDMFESIFIGGVTNMVAFGNPHDKLELAPRKPTHTTRNRKF